MKEKNNKSVYIIVRELPEIKEKLTNLAITKGFSDLSKFIRNEWSKWL